MNVTGYNLATHIELSIRSYKSKQFVFEGN